jgi:hypothetical protein
MPRSIICPRCGRESFNANDIRERYCGACHAWHSEMQLAELSSNVWAAPFPVHAPAHFFPRGIPRALCGYEWNADSPKPFVGYKRPPVCCPECLVAWQRYFCWQDDEEMNLEQENRLLREKCQHLELKARLLRAYRAYEHASRDLKTSEIERLENMSSLELLGGLRASGRAAPVQPEEREPIASGAVRPDDPPDLPATAN